MIRRTECTAVFHIASNRRMVELFTMAGHNAIEHETVLLMKICAGRICLRRGGKNVFGFVLSEEGVNWRVRLENGRVVNVAKPEVEVDDIGRHKYVFDTTQDGYAVREYWPIRFSINNNGGKSKLTLNRFVYNKRTLNIVRS